MSDLWYFSKGDSSDRQGPISTDELRAKAASGEIHRDDLIRKDGMADWVPASSAKGLFPAEAPAPPPLPSSSSGPSSPPSQPVPPPLPQGSAARSTGRPRRSASSQSQISGSGLPSWALGAGIAAAIIVGLAAYYGWRGGGAARRGSGGTVRPDTQPSMNMADLPPPDVDPRLLVGSWTFLQVDAAGVAHAMTMALRPDGRFSTEMKSIARSGAILESGNLSGYWRVSGTTLWLSKAGVVPEIANEIVEATGKSLTLRDASTGMLKPFERPPPVQHPEASNPYLQELTGLNATEISRAMDTAAERQKVQRQLRRIVHDLGLSGADLVATPEQELRRRLAAANYQAELIEVVMAARLEKVRARILRGGRDAAPYGSGFSSQRPAESRTTPASTKPDTSYRAYAEWRRQRGMPVSDGAPTESELAAYHKWREAQGAAAQGTGAR